MAINAFYCDLDEFCRKYLVSNKPVTQEDFGLFVPRKMEIDSSIFENLMIFDKTTLKVYGENIPLAYLLGIMGERAFEELVEQDAIGFVLWRPMVTYFLEKIEGVDPLSSGNTSSPAHSDPEQSLELGLKWLKQPMLRAKRRSLIRKLRDKYEITEDQLPHDAVRLVRSAYDSRRLDAYGFDSGSVLYRDIQAELIPGLAKHAENILEYIFLLNNQLSSVSKKEYFDYLLTSSDRLTAANSAMSNFCKISDVAGIPDLKMMFHNTESPFTKLLKVRNKGYARRFRGWLSEVDGELDSAEAAKAYYEAILKPQGFFKTTPGKITKTLSMTAIGMGVGALVGGPAAMALGAVGGKLIEGAADTGLDLMDQYLLDGMMKGWTPKVFIEKLEKEYRKDIRGGRIEPSI